MNPEFSNGSIYSEKSAGDFDGSYRLSPSKLIDGLRDGSFEKTIAQPEEICLVYSQENLDSKYISGHKPAPVEDSDSKVKQSQKKSSDSEMDLSDSELSD